MGGTSKAVRGFREAQGEMYMAGTTVSVGRTVSDRGFAREWAMGICRAMLRGT